MNSWFTASELVKLSAKRLNEKGCGHLEMMTANHLNHAVSKYTDMVGEFHRGNISVLFNVDEIRETRNYLQLCTHEDGEITNELAIYSAFIGALVENSEHLTQKGTAGEAQELVLKRKQLCSRLYVGSKGFRVSFDMVPVMRFFLTKARASLDPEKAERFDERYKHREWALWFQNHVKYKRM